MCIRDRTLSVGERERKTYLQWKNAGADRYLLRHETADSEHYKNLHPKELSLARRLDCLRNLKDLGLSLIHILISVKVGFKINDSTEALVASIKPDVYKRQDDGLIELEVKEVQGKDIVCHVINGGELGARKGVNVPNVKIKMCIRDRGSAADGEAGGVPLF